MPAPLALPTPSYSSQLQGCPYPHLYLIYSPCPLSHVSTCTSPLVIFVTSPLTYLVVLYKLLLVHPQKQVCAHGSGSYAVASNGWCVSEFKA